MSFKVWNVKIWSNIDQKTTLDPGPVFGSIFDGFGIDFGVILTPKIDQKSMLKFDRFSDAFWEGFGAAFLNYHGINMNLGAPGGG